MNRSAWFYMGIAVLLTAGCSSTKFTKTEVAEGIGPVDFTGKKVAVMAVATSEDVRANVENAIVEEMNKRGIIGVASHTIIPLSEISNSKKSKAVIAASGASALVYMKLVGMDKTTKYTADDYGQPHYGSLMSYYDHAWINDPVDITARTYVTYIVETICYRVSDQKMIWKGTSETFSPKNEESFAKEIIEAARKVMKKQGVLADK